MAIKEITKKQTKIQKETDKNLSKVVNGDFSRKGSLNQDNTALSEIMNESNEELTIQERTDINLSRIGRGEFK